MLYIILAASTVAVFCIGYAAGYHRGSLERKVLTSPIWLRTAVVRAFPSTQRPPVEDKE